MSRCAHEYLLDLVKDDEQWILTNPNRFRTVVSSFRDETICPSIVFFIGHRAKARTLCSIAAGDIDLHSQPHGIANLFGVQKSFAAGLPLLYLDCTPSSSCTNVTSSWTICHENSRFTLDTKVSDIEALVSTIHVNIVIPLCHITCVFADDFECIDACKLYIDDWINHLGRRIRTEAALPPRLVLITTNEAESSKLRGISEHAYFQIVFSDLEILVTTADQQMSSVKTMLSEALQCERHRRQSGHVLFSLNHIANVFNHSISRSPSNAINFLQIHDAILKATDTDFVKSHLDHALAMFESCSDTEQLTDLLLSALMVQFYPVNVHRFLPNVIFNHSIRRVVENIDSRLTDRQTLDDIERKFGRLFQRLSPITTSYDVRRKILLKSKVSGASITTTQTCLWCFIRAPERSLRCGHCLCEHCLEEYYTPATTVYSYFVDRCFICGMNVNNTLRIKPPTVLPAILSIDGGGVRGIASLVLMKRLQAALDVPWPLWHFFELVVGTSVGGVIALDLVVGQHTIDESILRFTKWVSEIFPLPPPNRPTWCHKIYRFWAWLIRDSIYDSERLGTVMQEAFGKSQYLFGPYGQHWSGTKVGIMATEVSRSDLRIFTNYNGSGQRASNNGYQLLRPPLVAEEPLTNEVARATVAAPPYFRPSRVRGHQPVQDGGLRANNPCEPALWELPAIWSGIVRPSMVLSVGTGYHDAPAHKLTSESSWHSRGMPRIFRSFMMSPCLHGQNSWRALLNRIDETSKEDFIRLNFEFEDEEPALDNVVEVPFLKTQAEIYPIDFRPSRAGIWASAFFFELSSQPQIFCGYYICQGTIFCKFDDARPLIGAIKRAFVSPRLAIGDEKVMEFGRIQDHCTHCGFYQQAVRLETKSLFTPINITFDFDKTTRRHLSSFPNTIDWFMRRQCVSGEFRAWSSISRCACRGISRKRRRTWSSLSPQKRRRTF